MNVRWVAVLLLLANCAGTNSVSNGKCEAGLGRAYPPTSLVERTTFEQALDYFIHDSGADLLPGEPRAFVIQMMRKEFEQLEQRMQPGDELWRFRSEKCPGCGWYREGVVAVRACNLVGEVTVSDEM